MRAEPRSRGHRDHDTPVRPPSGAGCRRGLVALSSLFPLLLSAAAAANHLHCDVAIIGGGPAGVHTAYKLVTQRLTPGPVCLFERKDHLGGRVGDNFNVGYAGKPFSNGGTPVLGSGQTGTGGYRMYDNHYTYALGQELAALGAPGQLSFLAQNSISRLSGVENQEFNPAFRRKRYFTYNNGDIAQYFKPLYNSPISDDLIWTAMLCGPQVPTDDQHVPQYDRMAIPDLGRMSTLDYLEWVTENVISPEHGVEVAQYLLDVYRFRADFDSPIDAVSYLQYTAKDYTGGAIIYPIPSFQPYFDIMQAQIERNGGRIYLNEKVHAVNSARAGHHYLITTSKHTVSADTVIIATHHSALQKHDPNDPHGGMSGDVIREIVRQLEYRAVQESVAVTVTHQFGDGKTPSSGWWHGDIDYPDGPELLGPQLTMMDSPLRRSSNNFMIRGERLPGCHHPGCDFSRTLFFNNTNELPLTDYHDFINISRSVYNDKRDAVDNWAALWNAGEALAPGGGGDAAVNRQVLKSLRLMYPRVFTGKPREEPKILATRVTVHKPAWYNLKVGAAAHHVSNESLFQWSLNPLPGQRVYLVGDSWRTDVSGWSDAAYKGSIYVLNRYFGAKIDPHEQKIIGCQDGNILYP